MTAAPAVCPKCSSKEIHYRQSKRQTACFLSSVLGQPASPGWVVTLQQQAAAAAPPPASAAAEPDVSAELTQLAQLHEQGILTDEEFSAKKAQILGI